MRTVEAYVGGFAVDGAEEEDADAHHGGGNDHGPFAADGGHAVHERSQDDTDDPWEVDVDVGAICVFQRQVDLSVLCGENGGEVASCESEAPEVHDVWDCQSKVQ